LRPGSCLPEYVIVPPASLKAHQEFQAKLAVTGVPSHAGLVSLGLLTTSNSRGRAYSEVVFNTVRWLTPQELVVVGQYIKLFGCLTKSKIRSHSIREGRK
jgi:hypothetical protein